MKPRYIHIGSWNIEHFGRADDTPSNQYAIAEHIEMSGVNVLALQEMYVTDVSGTKLLNSFLDKAFQLIEDHTGHKWEYEIFPNRDPGDRSQLCGIAWDTTRVTKERETLRIAVSHSATEQHELATEALTLNLWDRAPHAIKFVAKPGTDDGVRLTDFVIVPMHMKSNVGQRHVVMRTRFHEAVELIKQLPTIRDHFDEEHVILLGDTNCKQRNEDAIQAFINAGLEDLNEDDIPTYAIGNDAPFDRIFIPRRSRDNDFRFSRQYILRSASPLAHDKYLSDHYMVKTSILVRKDHDPEPVAPQGAAVAGAQ